VLLLALPSAATNCWPLARISLKRPSLVLVDHELASSAGPQKPSRCGPRHICRGENRRSALLTLREEAAWLELHTAVVVAVHVVLRYLDGLE
jgi:hypothetical protein